MYKDKETTLDNLLRKDVDASELELLREQLKDKISKEEFNEHLELMDGIDAAGRDDLKSKLKNIHAQHFTSTEEPKKFFTVNKLLSLLLILFLGVSALVYLKNITTVDTPQQIYAEYYKPYDYKDSRRDVAKKSMFSIGLLYQENKFDEIVTVYEAEIKNKDEMTSDLILAVGISYLENGDPYQAIYLFNQVIKNDDFSYIDQALWYKSMALIKAEEYKEGQVQLNKISADNNTAFAKNGKEVISKIEAYLNTINE